jgi:hypothetical protein
MCRSISLLGVLGLFASLAGGCGGVGRQEAGIVPTPPISDSYAEDVLAEDGAPLPDSVISPADFGGTDTSYPADFGGTDTSYPLDIVAPPDISICISNCDGKTCGDDGCGGSCGVCPTGWVCFDGNCQSTEELTCKGIFGCFDDCSGYEEDPTCYDNCLQDASPASFQQYLDIMQCLEDSGYTSCPEDDWECYYQGFKPCRHIYYECVHGEMSCVDMYTCSWDCPQGSEGEQCSADCWAEGSVEALETWDAYSDCLYEKGYYECAGWDSDCQLMVHEECNSAYQECVHGEESCGSVFDCAGECMGWDETCQWTCFAYGTIDAQDAYEALFACTEAVCEGKPKPKQCFNNALKQECAAQYDACLQDGAPGN